MSPFPLQEPYLSMVLLAASPAVFPKVGQLVRHAAPRVLENMIMPVASFYLGMIVSGPIGGMAASALWVYGGLALRLIWRVPVPGVALLAVLTLTVRTVVGMLSGSAVLFFLQPTLGIFCVSAAFFISLRGRRPLAERIARDLVPLPDHVAAHPGMRRFFVRQSLLWGCAQLVNGSFTLWMLLHEALETFLVVRTAGVAVLLGGTALWSMLDLRRTLGALQLRA
ncbi:VC0807 family protein [Nonomuraea sp. NPDC004354]